MIPKIFNNTKFEDIEQKIESLLHEIKRGKTMWRQRDVVLYEHPTDPDRLISDGLTFNGTMRVISDEKKSDWHRELGQTGNFITH